MNNRKQKIIKNVFRTLWLDILLLVVILIILIGSPIQAFVTEGGFNGIYDRIIKHPNRILTLIIFIGIGINIIRKIILSIQHTMNVVEFLDNNPMCNQREASIKINKHIEIVDKYIVLMSTVPYIIDVDKCSRFVVAKQKFRLFFHYYTIEFIDENGECISVLLPKLSERKGSAQELISYLNSINKYDNMD